MKTLAELKSYLKSEAAKIHDYKVFRKPSKRPEGQSYSSWTEHLMSENYRIHHIAYCLLRGRTIEQIEGTTKTKPLYWPNLEAIMKDVDLQRHRMYVLVRTDLPPIHQAVQAGHGVAQFLIDNKDTRWTNGTLVYLKAHHEEDLKDTLTYLTEHGYESSSWAEEDQDNQMTAVCCVTTDRSVFADREVLRF